MNQKIVDAVLERSQGLCEICGSNYMVQLHHCIKGRGKRTKCETEQSVISLCYEHHYGTEFGVHGKNGHNTDIDLKLQLQNKYKAMGKGEAEIRKLMGGRTYSEDDYK